MNTKRLANYFIGILLAFAAIVMLIPGNAATPKSSTPAMQILNDSDNPLYVSVNLTWDGLYATAAQFKTNFYVAGPVVVTNGATFQSTVSIAGATTAASMTSTGTLAAVAGATVGTTLAVGTSATVGTTLGVTGAATLGSMNIPNGTFGRPIAFGGSITLGATNSTYCLTVDAQTVTLPTAVGNRGLMYWVKLIDPAVSATVATTSSQKIDMAANYSITTSNTVVGFQADGTNWWRVSN